MIVGFKGESIDSVLIQLKDISMLTPSQINQLAELVNEAKIDVQNIGAVNEYVGLLLEDISGLECMMDSELVKVQADVLLALKNL